MILMIAALKSLVKNEKKEKFPGPQEQLLWPKLIEATTKKSNTKKSTLDPCPFLDNSV